MTALTLTVDRKHDRMRVALWQGGALVDLYQDSLTHPDLTGAIVAARIVRVNPGGKGAWAEAGLSENLFIEKAENLKTGDLRLFQIKASARQGKAHAALCHVGEAPSTPGLITPPPPLWARALADCGTRKIAALTFSDRADHAACAKFLAAARPDLAPKLAPLAKDNPHPDLDGLIDTLMDPIVPLPGGANLVIEQTEALVAIDVNGGQTRNALATNLAAAKEIGRQIRLRNLSGILIVDALKMTARPETAQLLNAMKRATAEDPAGVSVFGMTKLGLIEMTRQRKGPSLLDLAPTS